MSDDDLDTEGLCRCLNALLRTSEFPRLPCVDAVTNWWESMGWQVVAHTTGVALTSFVLTRPDAEVWVWLTVPAGAQSSDKPSGSLSTHYEHLDKHQRANALFTAIRECLVTDYTGCYVALARWQHAQEQYGPVLATFAPEGKRRAGNAAAMLRTVANANPGVDPAMLTMMAALASGDDAPTMPVTTAR